MPELQAPKLPADARLEAIPSSWLLELLLTNPGVCPSCGCHLGNDYEPRHARDCGAVELLTRTIERLRA